MTEHISAPVTADLVDAMTEAEKHLKNLDGSIGNRVNDKDHFGELAKTLEALVLAILSAQSSRTLLGDAPIGARFSVEPNGKLTSAVNDATAYLTGEARGNLTKGGLSQYESEGVQAARQRLVRLMGELSGSIRSFATWDMSRIQHRYGINAMIISAALVARNAH